MTEPPVESRALERLLAEDNFDRMTIDGRDAAGCAQARTVICIKPSCVRTNIVVGVE
ncbi:MAG: hypothetical protein ABI137_15690 [Antricoccus sp.]